MVISNIGRDKSFADDLNMERGIVSSRVALLLRSAEIKPIVLQICSKEQHLSFLFIFSTSTKVKGHICIYHRQGIMHFSRFLLFQPVPAMIQSQELTRVESVGGGFYFPRSRKRFFLPPGPLPALEWKNGRAMEQHGAATEGMEGNRHSVYLSVPSLVPLAPLRRQYISNF